MKTRGLWRKLGNAVQCIACNHFCTLRRGERGKCGVRKSTGRSIRLMVDNRPYGMAIDPIEKKPLFHFLPGSVVLSFGTVGCNFACPFCQNWDMSQSRTVSGERMTAREIVSLAAKSADGIAYTYNEPTIFAEFALRVMRMGKRRGLFNVWVSNGFMTRFTRDAISPYLDAINIDFKGSEELYVKIGARMKPVIESIADFRRRGAWVEVTTLVIPGENGDEATLEFIARTIADISPSIPWHVTAFHPAYLWIDRERTKLEDLEKAWKIGREWLDYVYIGNIPSDKESTYCPECGELLIERYGFLSRKTESFENGKCQCGREIEGVWS